MALIGANCKADVFSAKVNAASANIPTSYSTGAASLILTGIRSFRTLIVDNRTTHAVTLNCSVGVATAPSDDSNKNIYVNGSSMIAIDAGNFGNGCFIRSDTGSAITTGVVTVMAFGS